MLGSSRAFLLAALGALAPKVSIFDADGYRQMPYKLRRTRRVSKPHQGARECARRLRQPVLCHYASRADEAMGPANGGI